MFHKTRKNKIIISAVTLFLVIVMLLSTIISALAYLIRREGITITDSADGWYSGYILDDEASNKGLPGRGYYFVYQKIEPATLTPTGEIDYEILGFTFSRAKIGERTWNDAEPDSYFTISITDDTGQRVTNSVGAPYIIYSDTMPNGDTRTRWYISYDKIDELISLADPNWYSEIKSNDDTPQYIKVDAVMAAEIDNDIATFSGYFPDGTPTQNTLPSATGTPGVYAFTDISFGTLANVHNKDDLPTLSANIDQTSYNTKFDQYVLYLKDDTEPDHYGDIPFVGEPSDTVYKTFVTEDASGNPEVESTQLANVPTFLTYNDSRAFTDALGGTHTYYNLNRGIPSGERIINGFVASSTYGRVVIGKKQVVKKYTYKYKYNTLTYSQPEIQNDGTIYNPTLYVSDEKEGEVDTWASAWYYYIKELDLYDFERGTVTNNAFLNLEDSSNYITYTNTGTHNDFKTNAITDNKITYRAVISGRVATETNPITIDSWDPIDSEHVTFWEDNSYDFGNIGYTFASDDAAKTAAQNMAYERMPYSQQGANAAVATVKNDYLQIGDIIVLNDSVVNALNPDRNYDYTAYLREPRWSGNKIDLTNQTPKNNLTGYHVVGYESTTDYNRHNINIRQRAANGYYSTAIENPVTNNNDGVVYRRVLVNNSTDPNKFPATLTWSKGYGTMPYSSTDANISTNKAEKILDAVATYPGRGFGKDTAMGGYMTGEAFKVHTPVIAPVAIYDNPNDDNDRPALDDPRPVVGDGSDVQLVDPNASVTYHLRLDETYKFRFIPSKHIDEQGYGEAEIVDNAWDTQESDIKYDKYINKKYVHFPFTVIMQDKVYVPVEDENDPNYWIEIDDVSTTKFYIPVWAEEGIYEGAKAIKYRVEAQNVIDEEGQDHTDEEEDTANLDHENYVATYELTAQISGWVYDLTVVGVTDTQQFDTSGDYQNTEWYPFAMNHEEKLQGTLNRYGKSGVRYLKDGSINHHVNINDTLPFSNGRAGLNTGTLSRGTRIAFMLRTMGSSYADENDKVIITPQYRYVAPDGSVTDDINLYYHDTSGNGNKFIKFGDGTREPSYKTYLGMPGFTGSFYESDLAYTAMMNYYSNLNYKQYYTPAPYDLTVNPSIVTDTMRSKQLQKKNGSVSFSQVQIDSGMRLYTGSWEQLRLYQNVPGNKNAEGENFRKFNLMTFFWASINQEIYGIFRRSMQSWYSEYYIPSELYVTDGNVDLSSRTTPIDPNDETLFKKDGYLVLGFNIIVYDGDTPKLIYGTALPGAADGSNQWGRQGHPSTVTVGDINDPNNPKHPLLTITVNQGDVAVIQLDKELSDDYGSQIFTIN